MSTTLQTDTYTFSSSTGWSLVAGSGTAAIGSGVLTFTIPGATIVTFDGINGYNGPYAHRTLATPLPARPVTIIARLVSLTGAGVTPSNIGIGIQDGNASIRYSIQYANDLNKVGVANMTTNTSLALSSVAPFGLVGGDYFKIIIAAESLTFYYGTGTTTVQPSTWTQLYTATLTTTGFTRVFGFQRQVISGAAGTVTGIIDDLSIAYYVDGTDVYKQYMHAILPPTLQGPVGKQWSDGFANHLDTLLLQTRDAVKARFPVTAAAAGDTTALARIGDDRRLPRYPSETDTQYGARLQNAWDLWQKAGTGRAIITELEGIGYTSISFIKNADWTPSPPDGVTTWWSRFWCVIQGHPFTAPTYGSGLLYGGATLYGIVGATASDLDSIKKAIKKWKPAHSYCSHVVIAYSTAILPAGKTVTGFSVGNNAAYVPVGA